MSHRRQNTSAANGKRPQTIAAAVEKGADGKRSLEVRGYWLTLGSIALAFAFLWAYWPTLVEMVGQWIHQPDYSHGFLVIPIALFFLWSKRSQMPGEIYPSIWGVMLL